MAKNLTVKGINIIPLDIKNNTLVYGLNGTGKTRILDLIHKYHSEGITKNDLGNDMIVDDFEAKKYTERDKILHLLYDLLGELRKIEHVIQEEYSATISSYEKRKFDKIIFTIEDAVNKGKYTYTTYATVSNIIKYARRAPRESQIEDDENFNYKKNVHLSSKKVDFLLRRHVSPSVVMNLKKLLNREFEEELNDDKIIGAQKTYLIGVSKNETIIDDVLDMKKNEFSKIVKFNNYKTGKEIPVHEISAFYNNLNNKIINLNDELKNYFSDTLEFDLDFDTWQWDILRNGVKFDYNSLSSGEYNIIILLISVSLLNVDLLILDEPELSFSENYTERFNDSIEQLKPSKMNVLIATHSYYIFKDFNGDKIELLSGNKYVR